VIRYLGTSPVGYTSGTGSTTAPLPTVAPEPTAPPLGTTSPSIPPAVELLAQEARKYKSAEEFSRAWGNAVRDFLAVEQGKQRLINPEGFEKYKRIKEEFRQCQENGSKDMNFTDFYNQVGP